MLHKKTLERLRKEAGVCYYDLDQVNKALDVCRQKYVMFGKEIKEAMCFHNVILDDLLKYNVISPAEFNIYYNQPSFRFILNALGVLLSSYLVNNPNDVNKEKLINVQKHLNILKSKIRNNDDLRNLSKLFVEKKFEELKDDIKTAKEETEALIYIKRKLKKKGN